MESLLVLLALIAIPLSPVGAAVVVLVVLMTDRARRQALRDAPALFDEVFDGRETAEITVHHTSAPREVVEQGARERGYRLVSESSPSSSGAVHRLVFERVPPV
ncbi:hypothetical protein [Brachybacterium phenoliresistens]|uniref:hypothetical protein n=1 Tax=Brachybacterium phenoliresistens TaxID=396014 RepID=UPI0004B284AE|nr:hypothetical protein [Brachybacterium phenoliresistens]